VRVYFQVFADRAGIRFESRRVRLCMIPLPLRVMAYAHGDESSWTFEVTVARIGSYQGAVVSQL
jgi:hypothetical protein